MNETDKPIPDLQENIINECWYKQIKNGIMIKIIQTKHETGGNRMTKQEVLMIFAQAARKILKHNLSKLIVYGSYARGDYRENSDIDVMILTPLSDEEIEHVENEIFDLAYDLELESGVIINPVLENEAHYKYWLGALPFYDNVEKEGVVIG